MGKTSMCISMLEILNTGRVYKISDLASLLETNPRNVIEYKKELEEAGYYITSIPGRYGGYQLERTNIFPSVTLTENEKAVLNEGYEYILSKKDFVNKDIYTKGFGKVSCAMKFDKKDENLLVVDHYQLTMGEKDIEERYKFIEDAIKAKRVIEIGYDSLKNGSKTHILHPYKLFIYNNSWFFLAWNPEVGDVWYFKLNRMSSWKLKDEKFRVWKGFKAENYFDFNGFKVDDTYEHIKLEVTGVRKRLFKERVYGKNQHIVDYDDNMSVVEFDAKNDDQLLNLILSCGVEAKVLEPTWLKDKVIEISKAVLEKYEK